jgi:hypothetical protein
MQNWKDIAWMTLFVVSMAGAAGLVILVFAVHSM